MQRLPARRGGRRRRTRPIADRAAGARAARPGRRRAPIPQGRPARRPRSSFGFHDPRGADRARRNRASPGRARRDRRRCASRSRWRRTAMPSERTLSAKISSSRSMTKPSISAQVFARDRAHRGLAAELAHHLARRALSALPPTSGVTATTGAPRLRSISLHAGHLEDRPDGVIGIRRADDRPPRDRARAAPRAPRLRCARPPTPAYWKPRTGGSQPSSVKYSVKVIAPSSVMTLVRTALVAHRQHARADAELAAEVARDLGQPAVLVEPWVRSSGVASERSPIAGWSAPPSERSMALHSARLSLGLPAGAALAMPASV